MKNLIKIAFLALTLTLIGTADAKFMKKQTIPITRNERNILEDTKQVKAAVTPEGKIAAAQQLAADLQRDPYTLLKLQEKMIKKDIKEKELEIKELQGEERDQAIMEKEDLEEQLAILQDNLEKYNQTQPKEVSRLKEWALYTLLATFGLVIADQLITGGTGRAAISEKIGSAVSTGWDYVPSTSNVWEKTKSGLETAWGYVPSWNSTPSPETTLTEPITETSSTLGSSARWLAGAAGGFAMSIAIAQAKQYALKKTLYALLNYITGAEEDPETVDPQELRKAKVEAENLKGQIKVLEKEIAEMKAGKR